VEVVRELLKHGAKVESVEEFGRTPLLTAVFKSNVEVFRELLKHGAEVESADNFGYTPLNTAASEGHVDVVRELVSMALKWKVQIILAIHLSTQQLQKATWMLSGSC